MEKPKRSLKCLEYFGSHSVNGILNVCFDVRGSISGASDPWDSPNLELAEDMLYEVLATWHETNDVIDDAVRIIIKEVLRSIHGELMKRIESK